MQLELIKLTLISEVNAGSFLISKLSIGPLSKCKTHGIPVEEESFVFMSCWAKNKLIKGAVSRQST